MMPRFSQGCILVFRFSKGAESCWETHMRGAGGGENGDLTPPYRWCARTGGWGPLFSGMVSDRIAPGLGFIQRFDGPPVPARDASTTGARCDLCWPFRNEETAKHHLCAYYSHSASTSSPSTTHSHHLTSRGTLSTSYSIVMVIQAKKQLVRNNISISFYCANQYKTLRVLNI